MNIKILQTGPIQTNTYILEGKNSLIVIDPGDEPQKIQQVAEAKGKPINFVLLTHAHWDHTGAVEFFQKKGAKVYLHKLDLEMTTKAPSIFGKVNPDVLFDKDETVMFDNIPIRVIHTPGHSQGSVCFETAATIFSGDTLFRGEVGRCDLPSGNFTTLKKSLQKIFALAKNHTVYPGHGDKTSLDYEMKNNPYA